MTTIIEGMTPLQFITVMNDNFTAIKYPDTSITTIDGSSNVNVIAGNFTTVENETTNPPVTDSVIAGINGIEFISKINGNFTRYLGPDMTFTVGTGKNYATINEAITRSVSENNIIIDAGTYNEHIDLTTKRLNFTGSGTLETIIYYFEHGNSATHYNTLNIGQDCTFNNILIRKKTDNQSGQNSPILNIVSCDPVFTACEVYSENADLIGAVSHMGIADISGGSNVIFTGIIDCIADSTLSKNVTISDTSTFNFVGTKFKARINSKDNSIVNIETDDFYTFESTYYAIVAEDDSEITLTVNDNQIAFNQSTESTFDTGLTASFICYLDNDCSFTLHGKVSGPIYIVGTGVTLLMKDVVGTKGKLWITSNGGTGAYVPNTTLIIMDNCQLNFDFDDNGFQGHHIIEDYMGCEWRIINGSVLEFQNAHGVYHGYGQPVTTHYGGKIYMRNSSLIRHGSDVSGYNVVSRIEGDVDIEDSIITQEDWLGVDAIYNILHYETTPIRIRLKNVTFNNDSNTSPINLGSSMAPFDPTDYICESGSINNTGQNICQNMTDWALLKANCPL